MISRRGHLELMNRLKTDACAIISYQRQDNIPVPAGRLERELRDLEGVKEVTINHLTATVKIRYDPRLVTVERIRSILKKFRSRKRH